MVASATSHNFPAPLFVRSQERRGFTLESTILPMDRLTNFISIFSHNAVEDGLYIKSNEIRFTVEFNTLGAVTVAFPIPDEYESYTVQAVYDVSKIQLYVNGKVYSEAAISDAQLKDGFKTRASNNLYIGQGTASGKMFAIDGMAIYARALTDSECYLHHQAVNRVLPSEELSSIFGGVASLTGGVNSRNIILNRVWNPQWTESAVFNKTATSDGRLVPEVDYLTGNSKSGQWSSSFSVDGWPTVYNIVIKWVGQGNFIVEASLNGGTSWVAVTNGVPVTGTHNVSTTSLKPVVRVTFTGGVANDPSRLDSMSTTVYGSSAVYTSDSQRSTGSSITTMTFDKAFEPIQRGLRHGLSVVSDVTLTADTISTDPQTFQTIETWVKWDSSVAGQYAYDLRPGIANGYLWVTGTPTFAWAIGTVYINGSVATSGTVPMFSNRWYHVVHVLPAAYNTAIILGSKVSQRVTYARFTLHPTTLNATQALNLFNAYHAYPTARLATESNPFSETATPYKIYQNDWALIKTGN